MIGLRNAAGSRLNPSADSVIGEGDQVIALAGDDSTLGRGTDGGHGRSGCSRHDGCAQERPQRVLILGWNSRTANVVHELDQYLQPGSKVTVVADQAGVSG